MFVDVCVGATVWAMLCWLFIAVFGAAGMAARSDDRRLRTLTCSAGPRRSIRAGSAGSTSFLLDLDAYGLDRQERHRQSLEQVLRDGAGKPVDRVMVVDGRD